MAVYNDVSYQLISEIFQSENESGINENISNHGEASLKSRKHRKL